MSPRGRWRVRRRFFFHHPAIAGHPLAAQRNEGTPSSLVFMCGRLAARSSTRSTRPPTRPLFIISTASVRRSRSPTAPARSPTLTRIRPTASRWAIPGRARSRSHSSGAFGVRAEGPLYQMRARYYDPLSGASSRVILSALVSRIRALSTRTSTRSAIRCDILIQTGRKQKEILGSAYGKGPDPVSLVGNVSEGGSDSPKNSKCAKAFGSEKQIVGIGLGILFAEQRNRKRKPKSSNRSLFRGGLQYRVERILERSRKLSSNRPIS